MKKLRTLRAYLAVVFIGLTGCKQPPAEKVATSTQEQKAIAALAWTKTADVNADYESAISNKDYRLWVIASRPPSMPGVAIDEYHLLEKKCGKKYLPGIGDVLFGKTHQIFYSAAIDYATAFNKKMRLFCESRSIDEPRIIEK